MADALLKFTGAGETSNPRQSSEIPVTMGTPLPVILVGLTQFASPSTGNTVVMAATTGSLVLTPAGTLAALTVTLPTPPYNGQIAGVSSTQIITALTVNTSDGSSLSGTPSAMAANGSFRMAYNAATTTWIVAP